MPLTEDQIPACDDHDDVEYVVADCERDLLVDYEDCMEPVRIS